MINRLFKRKKSDSRTNINLNKKDNLSGFKKIEKTEIKSFDDLLEQFAAFSFDKQLNFGNLIGTYNWQFDMNQGTITFGENLVFPVQIIGSLSFNDSSWMWGWANSQSGFPENLLNQSNELKHLGEKLNIKKLTDRHYTVEERFEHKIGMIASGYFSCDSYYCANYGQGTLVVTIKSNKIPKLNKSPDERVLSTFPQFISSREINHKEAFKNYLIDYDFNIEISEEEIKGSIDNKVVVAKFDSAGRLIKLDGKI